MNKNGTPQTLVASHPGNTNAMKYGVHSPREIESRAATIVADLTQSFEFSLPQLVAVEQVARCVAILEALDRDLDERGLVDKRGEPRYLLNHRSRISRQLDRWLSKIASSIERQTATKQPPSRVGRAEYIHELERIALGDDSTASARDRIIALTELLKVDSAAGGRAPGAVFNVYPAGTVVERNEEDQEE